jgi:hypothetical protein
MGTRVISTPTKMKLPPTLALLYNSPVSLALANGGSSAGLK